MKFDNVAQFKFDFAIIHGPTTNKWTIPVIMPIDCTKLIQEVIFWHVGIFYLSG